VRDEGGAGASAHGQAAIHLRELEISPMQAAERTIICSFYAGLAFG
jgi:hypothetical protein